MTRLWRAALKAQSKADAESDAESEPECQVVEEHAQRGPDAQAEADAQGEEGALGVLLLCNSKNEPPAMQGEGRSLDKSMNSCARIKVGLQNHK